MFQSLKQHPRLFISLFLIPLLFHLVIWQLGTIRESSISGVPVRVCQLMMGVIWGGASGLLSFGINFLLFRMLPKWQHLRNESVMYAVCWLFPFCYMTLFGAAMANDVPHPLPLAQEIIAGLEGLAVCGVVGGIAGIIAFTATQIPGFRSRYSFLIAVVAFVVACYIKSGWQSPILQNLPHIPPEIALCPVVSMFLGVVMNLTALWMTLLIIWRIVTWLQNFKMSGAR